MEIFSAISDFISPDTDGSQNILSFKKGDKFEIFDVNKTSAEWWGARAVADNAVGYVPSKYMKVCNILHKTHIRHTGIKNRKYKL